MVTTAPHPEPSSPAAGRGGLRLRQAGMAVLLLLAAWFLLANRAEIPRTLAAARDADPWFLLCGVLFSAAFLLNQAAFYQAAYRALGLAAPFRRMLRLAAAGYVLNTLASAGGVAGVAVHLQEAGRRRQPRGPVTAAYLLCGLLGHIAFALLLAAGLVIVWVDARLTLTEALASAVFAVYTAGYAALVVTAAVSRPALRALYALPGRLTAAARRLARRPATTPLTASAAADELYDAIRLLRRRPAALVRPAAHALVVEVLGVAMLWAALRAFGQHAGVSLPVIGYAISVLFGIVWVLPAGLGAVELSLGAVLLSFNVTPAATALVVLTYRLFELWLPLAAGAWSARSLIFSPEARATPVRRRPGLKGRTPRRAVAALAVAVGLLNVALVLIKHPPLRLAALHGLIPHAAVSTSRYVVLLSGLALLAAAPALAHGKRQAWRIAVAAALASALAHPFKRTDVLGSSAGLVTLAVLLAGGRRFPARSDPLRVRQGVWWLLAGGAGVLAYGFAGLYLLDAEFRRPVHLGEALENAVRLLFLLPSTTIEPLTRHGAWFIDSVRVLTVVVLAVAMRYLLHPVIHRATAATAERERVRAVLEEYARTSLAYFHLLEDKSYFFAGDGRAFIGYTMVEHVAVALGEPVGAPDACQAVARDFAEYCDLNGWGFCFYQVTLAGAEMLAAAGLRALKIGEEAVVPVQQFTLSGRAAKSIRAAVNRLEREGYRVEALPRPLEDTTYRELAAVSDAWLAHGGHRERAFTLGAFDRDYLDATGVVAVRAPDGRIEAFANLLPSFRSADGNFDLMRRRPDAPNGVIEYLFVWLIDAFRQRGCTGMSLGLAPLAGIEGNDLKARALRLLYQRGERAFRFQGLRTFKEKWQPRWEPRYLVYRGDLQLPRLALAVARAGERGPHSLRAWLRQNLPARHRGSSPAASL